MKTERRTKACCRPVGCCIRRDGSMCLRRILQQECYRRNYIYRCELRAMIFVFLVTTMIIDRAGGAAWRNSRYFSGDMRRAGG